jgi:hypothetical protein
VKTGTNAEPSEALSASLVRAINSSVVERENPSYCCNVVFVCTDNSVDVEIAQLLLSRHGDGEFRAFPAAVAPTHLRLVEDKTGTSKAIDGTTARVDRLDGRRMHFLIHINGRGISELPETHVRGPQVLNWRISSILSRGTKEERERSLEKTLLELGELHLGAELAHQKLLPGAVYPGSTFVAASSPDLLDSRVLQRSLHMFSSHIRP